MHDINAIKSFISSVEINDYNIQILSCTLIPLFFVVPVLLIMGNVFTIIMSLILSVLEALFVSLFIRKKKKHIFLVPAIAGWMLSLSIGIPTVNLFYNNKKIFTIMIMVMAISHLLPSISTCITIRKRITNNSFKSQKRSAGDQILPGGILVLTGLIGMIAGKIITQSSLEIGTMIMVLIMIGFGVFSGCKSSEQLLRHIFVCKYDLEDAIRIRDEYERRL